MPHSLGLFGTDGIRNVDSSPIFEWDNIKRLVCAASQVIGKSTNRKLYRVVVGRDTRRSSPEIARGVFRALPRHSHHIIDAGITSTPCLSLAVKDSAATLGIMITASHNPYYYNGIKLFGHTGTKIDERMERAIETKMAETDRCRCSIRGTPRRYDMGPQITRDYYKRLKSIGVNTMHRLAVDCANGVASYMAKEFFKHAGITARAVFDDPSKKVNDNCGAEFPDSLRRRLKPGLPRSFNQDAPLQKRRGLPRLFYPTLHQVKGRGEIGAAFDGDMDRVILIDEDGAVFNGDNIIAFLALKFKERGKLKKGHAIVITSMANYGLEKFLSGLGLKAVRTDVGDRNVADTMKTTGSILGGEQSGHIILPKFMPTGCGLTTLMTVLMHLGEDELRKYSRLFTNYPQRLVSIPVQEKVPIHRLKLVPAAIERHNKMLDGSGRIVVRYSGTENKCRVMVECSDRKTLARVMRELCAAVRKELA